MSLFDLIEQHDGVGLTPHGLRQLAAFVIADVSWRRSDQPGHGELLHVLRHVDTHHVLLIVKQRGGQRFGQLRLAHACGAQEQEGSDGSVGVSDAGPAPLDGLHDLLYGLILAYDPLVQDLVQAQDLLPLALHQLGHGDAGPAGHDGGDLLVRYRVAHQALAAAFFDRGVGFRQFLFQAGQFAVLQAACGLVVGLQLGGLDAAVDPLNVRLDLLDIFRGSLIAFPDGFLAVELLVEFLQLLQQLGMAFLGQVVLFLLERRLFDLQLHDLSSQRIQFLRHGIHLGADRSAGFVHQVDGLVRQETVGDVAVGEGGGGHQGVVVDGDPVIDLVSLLQSSEDGDRVFHGRFVHHDGLETPLQRGIGLDVLAVFVQGRSTDAVQLAPGQHGLQQVARIHGTFGLAGTDDGVELIDEQDDLALALLHLVQHALESFLEFAPVHGPCDEGAHVQRHDGLLL